MWCFTRSGKESKTVQASSITNKSLISFFVWAFVFSWLFWGIAVLGSIGIFSLPFPNMVLVVIGAHGPLAAAMGLTYKSGGWRAVKGLLRSGFDLRLGLIWWLVILSLPFLLAALAVQINVAQSGFQPDTTLLSQPLLILPTFLILFFLGGSFQEEFGWRGFALPRLLETWNPAAASIILGAVWGVWHLPLFHIADTSQVYMRFEVFFVLAIAFSVLFTWFYLRTNKNLFTALLFHTAINTSLSVFPPIEQKLGGNQAAFTYLMLTYVLVALGVIFTDRSRWFGSPK
jgi:uncharacterized protein